MPGHAEIMIMHNNIGRFTERDIYEKVLPFLIKYVKPDSLLLDYIISGR